ncbi:MAG: membrane protein insertase YidC [Gemmatimonadales bacterium]|nr:membrane protein insertase YidC [Gemmatimonadales bacterium]NIN10451.1 membrane protein insertase YidC [Gemmatimonadales bacterium]NIN49243.1 membrane protein insertase YidC [Gemmatimonadales bacterium]NIP06707.1 membrane protein insertase YidC [Gemmatimonadales bacterium]NIR00038.1 membrane protein insertase YidC [Gemmatimonadales bacterium]
MTREPQPAETARVSPPVPTVVPPLPTAVTPADTTVHREITVDTRLYRLAFSTRGARLVRGVLKEYRTFAPGDTGWAHIIPNESQFLAYHLVVGNDTVPLADWSFEPSDTELTVTPDGAVLEWVAQRGPITVRLVYTFRPDSYVFDVVGRIEGLETSGLMLVSLGPRLALVEADSALDFRSYSVVTKAGKTESVTFRSLDPGERRDLAGPFEWVAVKSKYFVAAVLAIGENQARFGGAVATGRERVGRHAVRADVVASLPVPGGEFSFSTYLGPQEFQRLKRIGHDLEDINPYGWIFRPIIRPFANLIVIVLLWMHQTLSLEYGWVLILFGLAVRVLLWPLNQKAMRSSVAMQAIQPELKAVQERYKQDPQRMQQEVMKLYRQHGVNPLGGCVPMLIPMPVLFALFFVFRETIEFRGVPFLWLPDLSRADPYFIIPILMGLSMFAVTKLGQRGVPPNPQAKMMLYVMPAFLTFIFLRLSAGLNLYYAVSNIASIPQQWLIAKERMKRVGK